MSWPVKNVSPSSPGGNRPESEEKAARGSELSRDGDTQWDCSDESSMLAGKTACGEYSEKSKLFLLSNAPTQDEKI